MENTSYRRFYNMILCFISTSIYYFSNIKEIWIGNSQYIEITYIDVLTT